MIKKISLFLCFSFWSAATNVAVVIDTATIEAWAQGSLNSIGGDGNFTDPISIPDNATFEYFTVELSDFHATADGGLPLPSNLAVSFRITGQDANGNPIIIDEAFLSWNRHDATNYLGSTFTVSSNDNADVFALMLGYVPNSGVQEPNAIRTNMFWDFGGVDTVATATLTVKAYGEPPPVPIPTAVWLFDSGLLGLISVARRMRYA